VLIEHRPATDPELTALVMIQQREVRDADGGVDGLVYPVHDDAEYLVAVVGGRVVGCGAVQALDADSAEIKRMYVRPAYRGRGIARQLLAALEAYAAAGGHGELRLETGTYLPAAIALYTSSGYERIPAYGEYAGNPYSVCFAKRVRVPA
jgi:putative acetyltransferase